MVSSSTQRHPYPAQTLTLDLPAHQVSHTHTQNHHIYIHHGLCLNETNSRHRVSEWCVIVVLQVAEGGGTMQAECRMSLGQHSLSTYRTLRVRARQESYVRSLHSHGQSYTNSQSLTRSFVYGLHYKLWQFLPWQFSRILFCFSYIKQFMLFEVSGLVSICVGRLIFNYELSVREESLRSSRSTGLILFLLSFSQSESLRCILPPAGSSHPSNM